MSTALTPALLFKTLADETRWRISQLIAAEGELCVCELTTALEESQPKISRHLAQLRSSGLLQDRRSGQWIYYRLHPQLDAWARQIIELAGATESPQFNDDLARLNSMGNRPERQACCT